MARMATTEPKRVVCVLPNSPFAQRYLRKSAQSKSTEARVAFSEFDVTLSSLSHFVPALSLHSSLGWQAATARLLCPAKCTIRTALLAEKRPGSEQVPLGTSGGHFQKLL